MEFLSLLYKGVFPIVVLLWSILAILLMDDEELLEGLGVFVGFPLVVGLFILERYTIFPFYGVVLALALLAIPVIFILSLVAILSDAEKKIIPIAAITLLMFLALIPWLTIKAERDNSIHCGSTKVHKILLFIEEKEKKIPAMGFFLKLAKSKNYKEELLLNASFSLSYSLVQHLIYSEGTDPGFCLQAEKPSFSRRILQKVLNGFFPVIFTTRVGGNSPLLALMEGYFYPHHLFAEINKNRKRENYPRIAKLLISRGAPINCKDWRGNIPLHLAAKIGEASVVEMLISKGADVKAKNKYSWPPLFFAANRKVLNLLMENGASLNELDLNAPDPTGRTPLYAALAEGRVELAELLIEHGAYLGKAELNKKNKEGKTPLHFAVEKGSMKVIKYLLEHGADINAKDKYDWPPLFYSPTEEILSFLLLKGASLKGVNLDAEGENGETPLHMACRLGVVALAEFLINRGADVKEKDEQKRTPLHKASQSGSVEIVKLLLEKGAEVDRKDEYGRTPLYYAAASGNGEVAKFLIDHGADVLAKDENGQSILHAAARGGLSWLAELCIRKGADINARDSDGWTPLHVAAEYGETEVAKLLIEHGADVNAKDKYGLTPLFYAAWKGHLKICKLLVSHGAQWNRAVPKYGFPASQAAAEDHLEVVKYFVEELGFDINAEDKAGWTLLHWAAAFNAPKVASYLIRKGADVNAKNKYGETSLHLAARRGHSEVAKLLLSHGADVNAKTTKKDECCDKTFPAGSTPLDVAILAGKTEIAKLLISHGGRGNATCSR